MNDDGFIYDQYVAWAAAQGDSACVQILTVLASANPGLWPDRASDIALAASVLEGISAAAPGPVTPTPAPASVTFPAVADDIKAVVTVLGGASAVGTWCLEAFAGAMSPGVATAVSSAIVLVTGLMNKLIAVEKSLATETARQRPV